MKLCLRRVLHRQIFSCLHLLATEADAGTGSQEHGATSNPAESHYWGTDNHLLVCGRGRRKAGASYGYPRGRRGFEPVWVEMDKLAEILSYEDDIKVAKLAVDIILATEATDRMVVEV